MKHIYNNVIIRHCRAALMVCLMMISSSVMAQITSVHGTVSDDFGPLMGAAVCEIDGNGRIIESTVTDMNGNFVMKVKNEKDKLRISFVGLKTQTFKFDKSTFDVKMESATTLQEVTVKSKKRMNGGGLAIPEREVSFARQSIDTKEFEGLGLTTIDEALQGRIAGLDIVAGSGNLGSGSVMRLRGASSLSSLTNQNPLIVVDGNVREVDMSNFDLSSSSDEKFAELLNINTEDIASINVLKDASATAIYGSQGGNGVIELVTKRGSRGKPKVTYSLKLTGTYQPKGNELLNGDDYTMLLKEAYFNPAQNEMLSINIPEINYNPNFSEYEQYNNNTDWREAVTQWGLRQNHYVTISGGGEKATFRVSAGFDNETGTIIKQQLNRLSTRVNLDYNVSQRIRVQTNFAMTYTQNEHNYDNLLSIAQKKMPNMSIYEQDANGNNTDRYYNMIQSGANKGTDFIRIINGNYYRNLDSSQGTAFNIFHDDQIRYANPVALAHLAKNVSTTYDLNPELVINYELLGMDDEHTRLTWRGQVYMNIFNEYVDRYLPAEINTYDWNSDQINRTYVGSRKSVALTTKHTLTFTPAFRNKDHSMQAMGRFEYTSGSASGQSVSTYGTASGIQSSAGGGKPQNPDSYFSEWRSMYITFSGHYAYKSRYIADVSMRVDATTKLSQDKRWGFFPSVSLRWNVIDEPFMSKVKDSGILTMLSVRPSWGMVGHAPNRDYLFNSKYGSTTEYMDIKAMTPINLRLDKLSWEMVNSFNLGFDFGFLNDRINLTFEYYNSTTSNMLMSNYSIPTSTGYGSLEFFNSGKMKNEGWEFHVNTNKLVKAGKFGMDLNVNFGNNRNTILEMDESVLKKINTTIDYTNRQALTRIQVNNPFGSIYGYRSKGVYQFQYETINGGKVTDRKNPFFGQVLDTPEKQQAFIDAGFTAPVALDENGKIIRQADGTPKQMQYNYTLEDNEAHKGKFKGGDAIYEDVNHDGNINKYDIMYLGSSLPMLTGGFGFTFTYGDWRLSTQFTYRVGNKILNLARLDSEAMINNNNQSQAVNYRWRKEGDVTTIPRAMYGADSNYNTLVSDRFVEDGSYLRMSYAQISYTLKKKIVKSIGLQRLSLYASANNPFVITKYTGVDPDISSASYGPATDWSQTPRSRSFTFGMTVDF